MTRAQHLEFCSICYNRQMDPKQGLVCKLTSEIADFEGDCPSFEKDDEQEEKLFLRKLDSTGDGVQGDPVNFRKNKANGQIIIVIGVGILLLTLMFPSPVIIIPFGSVIYGIVLYQKGVDQEKLYKERDGRDDDKKTE